MVAADIYTPLQQYFGYTAFRPLQEEIIRDVMANRDVFVLMPTGSGKSLCYQIPALVREGITIVISPLIALMQDQVDGLKQNGIAAAYFNSTLSLIEQDQVKQQLLGYNIKLLYVAPERLTQVPFMEFLQRLPVNLFAIDEAHCISEWGHDFRPDYRELQKLKQVFPRVPIIALTATATSRVAQDIIVQLNLASAKKYQASFNRPNLLIDVREKREPITQLLHYIEGHSGQSGIVYAQARDTVEEVASALAANGFKALPYHAGLENHTRRIHQERFIREDVDVIVATIAFGMGIDKPNVRFVVHFDLPANLERYYQEIGRAGRDGLTSECVLFFSFSDKAKIEYFIRKKPDEHEREIAVWQLRQMLQFARSVNCRRKTLLAYFGETLTTPCNACDNCLTQRETFDGTIITQKILSGIYRVGQRFGTRYVTNMLVGKATPRLAQNRHDTLSTFGILNEMDASQIQMIIEELREQGYVEVKGDQYPVLALTLKGKQTLKEKTPVYLTKRSLPQKKISRRRYMVTFEHDLFDRLRQLRKRLADAQDLPPYLIFSDATLADMTTYFPQDISHFSLIRGVGEQKLQTYAKSFIQEIRAYCVPRGLIQKSPDSQRKLQIRRNRNLTLNYHSATDTVAMFRSGLTLPEIVAKSGRAPSTIAAHLEQAYINGENITFDHLIPPEKQHVIAQVFAQQGFERLSPVKKILGDNYSYEELRFVRAKLVRQKKTRRYSNL